MNAVKVVRRSMKEESGKYQAKGQKKKKISAGGIDTKGQSSVGYMMG